MATPISFSLWAKAHPLDDLHHPSIMLFLSLVAWGAEVQGQDTCSQNCCSDCTGMSNSYMCMCVSNKPFMHGLTLGFVTVIIIIHTESVRTAFRCFGKVWKVSPMASFLLVSSSYSLSFSLLVCFCGITLKHREDSTLLCALSLFSPSSSPTDGHSL